MGIPRLGRYLAQCITTYKERTLPANKNLTRHPFQRITVSRTILVFFLMVHVNTTSHSTNHVALGCQNATKIVKETVCLETCEGLIIIIYETCYFRCLFIAKRTEQHRIISARARASLRALAIIIRREKLVENQFYAYISFTPSIYDCLKLLECNITLIWQ